MNQPATQKALAEALRYKTFKSITALELILGDQSAPVDFFANLEAEIIQAKEFARYIPIIKENVSTKKHQYNLTTHVVFWLADNQPYIYTPKPTVLHTRVGRSLKATREGSELMIPHNCKRYHVIAVRDGCTIHEKDETKADYLDVSITEYKIG